MVSTPHALQVGAASLGVLHVCATLMLRVAVPDSLVSGKAVRPAGFISTASKAPFRIMRERSGKMSKWSLNLQRSQLPLNQRVEGSNPCTHAKLFRYLDQNSVAGLLA